MTGAARELLEAQAALARPGARAVLACGCTADPGRLRPCWRHRREVWDALLGACESNRGECQEACCGPA